MIEESGSGGCESVGAVPQFRRSRSPVGQRIECGVLKPLQIDATRRCDYSGRTEASVEVLHVVSMALFGETQR